MLKLPTVSPWLQPGHFFFFFYSSFPLDLICWRSTSSVPSFHHRSLLSSRDSHLFLDLAAACGSGLLSSYRGEYGNPPRYVPISTTRELHRGRHGTITLLRTSTSASSAHPREPPRGHLRGHPDLERRIVALDPENSSGHTQNQHAVAPCRRNPKKKLHRRGM